MSEQPAQRMDITPEPTEAELAAIIAAVASLHAVSDSPESEPPPDAWRKAGRRESLRPSEWEKTAW